MFGEFREVCMKEEAQQYNYEWSVQPLAPGLVAFDIAKVEVTRTPRAGLATGTTTKVFKHFEMVRREPAGKKRPARA